MINYLSLNRKNPANEPRPIANEIAEIMESNLNKSSEMK
jgi:hypothetical protein